MFGSILILFALPFIDKSKVRSGRYRPMFKPFFWLFIVDAVFLGWLGSKEAAEPYITLSRLSTAYYFFFFLIVIPLVGKFEKPRGMPKSISASCPTMK